MRWHGSVRFMDGAQQVRIGGVVDVDLGHDFVWNAGLCEGDMQGFDDVRKDLTGVHQQEPSR